MEQDGIVKKSYLWGNWSGLRLRRKGSENRGQLGATLSCHSSTQMCTKQEGGL